MAETKLVHCAAHAINDALPGMDSHNSWDVRYGWFQHFKEAFGRLLAMNNHPNGQIQKDAAPVIAILSEFRTQFPTWATVIPPDEALHQLHVELESYGVLLENDTQE